MLRCALTRVQGCQLVIAIVVLRTTGALLSAGHGGGGGFCVTFNTDVALGRRCHVRTDFVAPSPGPSRSISSHQQREVRTFGSQWAGPPKGAPNCLR